MVRRAMDLIPKHAMIAARVRVGDYDPKSLSWQCRQLFVLCCHTCAQYTEVVARSISGCTLVR
jgi:hypothetical protein